MTTIFLYSCASTPFGHGLGIAVGLTAREKTAERGGEADRSPGGPLPLTFVLGKEN